MNHNAATSEEASFWYNPSAVISAAHAKLSTGDWEGGQFLFQSCLLEWTDDARESAGVGGLITNANVATTTATSSSSLIIPEQKREAVATLWLAYAHYLVDAKQFKTATQAYADAVASVVAGRVGRVHTAAARYALERNQRQTAIRIYRHALVGTTTTSHTNNAATTTSPPLVEDEQDSELLWDDFLAMMRETKPYLTMSDLRLAVAVDSSAAAPAKAATTTAPAAPPSKRTKHHHDSYDDTDTNVDASDTISNHGTTAAQALYETTTAMTTTATDSKTHVVTIESVQQLQTETTLWMGSRNDTMTTIKPTTEHSDTTDSMMLLDGTSRRLPPDVTAAWMSRDGHGLPLEPPTPSLFRPSPPKLSDPTSKDVLGVDLAVQLVQRLLSPSGELVLEVCRALWMLQAWTEQQCYAGMQAHDASLMEQHERLESEWDARWSVAGNPATADAVAQMNDQERQRFHWQASEQRQHAISQTVWNMRQLLCWQQQALAKLDVPGFTDEGITSMIDAESLIEQSHICQYLHSAFYIRNRMGSAPHETMLRSQLKKLARDQESGRGGGSHSPKMMAQPLYPGYPPPPQQQQQSYRGHGLVPPPPPTYSSGMMPQPDAYAATVQASMHHHASSIQMQPQPPSHHQSYHQLPPAGSYQPQNSPPQMMMMMPPAPMYPYAQQPLSNQPPPPNQMQLPPPYSGTQQYPFYQQ